MSEMENIELPKKLSKDRYDKLLIVMFNDKAYEKTVSRKDIAEATGITPNNTSTALTFLISIEAVSKDGNDNKLTELGMKYAQAIALGMLDEAKLYLNKLIINNGITKKLQRYISVNNNKSSEEIKKKIIEFSNKPINKESETAANTFFEMLVFANVIEEKDGKITLSNSEIKDISTENIIKNQSILETNKNIEKSKIKSINLNFNLKINLTPETNIKKLIEMINTIKDEISKD